MGLVSWNVRTMCSGLSTEPSEISDCRKTSIINGELAKFKTDVAALQETRLADSGQLREPDNTFFCRGKAADEVRVFCG